MNYSFTVSVDKNILFYSEIYLVQQNIGALCIVRNIAVNSIYVEK